MASNGGAPAVVDLAEVALAHPPRVVRISSALLTSEAIGHGALMLIARTLNRRVDQLRFDPDDPDTYAILPALAWVILRRAEPTLTLDECWTFTYQVVGPPEVAPAPLDPPSPVSSGPTPT